MDTIGAKTVAGKTVAAKTVAGKTVAGKTVAGKTVAARLASLRDVMAAEGFDALFVPRADEYLGEYIPPHNERLRWISGFTGSAGVAVILRQSAAIFVDGRYTVQADAQVDKAIFTIEHFADNPPEQWLEQNLKAGGRLGYDPWLHTTERAEKLKKACTAAGAALVAVDDNPIDALWRDRPAPPAGKVVIRDSKLAGASAAGARTSANSSSACRTSFVSLAASR